MDTFKNLATVITELGFTEEKNKGEAYKKILKEDIEIVEFFDKDLKKWRFFFR